jgi:hypothetical protein
MVLASAQDAKPHLAGCALMLLACVFAWKWIDAQRKHRRGMRWTILAGLAAGGAGAMVLSAVWAALVVPMMVWLGRGDSRESRRAAWRAFAIASVAGALTFVLSNPFLVFNTLFRRELVTSNLGNSAAMYGTSGVWRSVTDAFEIASAGLGPSPILILLIGGFLMWMIREIRRSGDDDKISLDASGFRLVLPATGATVVVFVLLAGGKPLEYARFGLPLAATGAMLVSSLIAEIRRHAGPHRRLDYAALQVWFVVVLVFVLNQRVHRADRIDPLPTNGENNSWAIWYEPAPWSLPPTDIFDKTLMLVPQGVKLPETTAGAIDLASRYGVSAIVFPSNLLSQARERRDGERISWRDNQWWIFNVKEVKETELRR